MEELNQHQVSAVRYYRLEKKKAKRRKKRKNHVVNVITYMTTDDEYVMYDVCVRI